MNSDTLLNAGAFPHMPKLIVQIEQADNIQEADISTDGNNVMLVSVPSEWSLTDPSIIGAYNQHLIEFSISALSFVAMLPNAEATIQELVETEQVFERATLFCHAGNSRSRIFGTHAGKLSDWQHWISKTYELKEQEQSTPVDSKAIQEEETNTDFDPQEFFGNMQSHNDIVISSVINIRYWDAAAWQGMMYATTSLSPSRESPPILGLIFGNEQKAKEIFQEWKNRFGPKDSDDEIRISVIKGIDSENPFYYRGCIAQDFDVLSKTSRKLFTNVSRMTTMTTEDHINLNRFLDHYNACGCYFLVPTLITASGKPDMLMDLAILKRKFHVREAWQIGAHDPDTMAIRPEDKVIIPEGETNPPVYTLNEWREDLGRRKREG